LYGNPGPGKDAEHAGWRLTQGMWLDLDLLWVARYGNPQLLDGVGMDATPRGNEGGGERLWRRTKRGLPDVRKGWLEGWTQQGVEFTTAAGTRLHRWAEIRGLALEADPFVAADWENWERWVLKDGSILPGKEQPSSSSEPSSVWKLSLPWGATMEIPRSEVVARHPMAHRLPSWESLQDHNLDLGGRDWTPRVNQAISGRALRMGGRAWPDGLGMRANSSATTHLVGPGLLEGVVGMDEGILEFHRSQDVQFRILLNGEEVWNSGRRQVHSEPLPFSLELPKAGELRLELMATEDHPLGAHGNWCVLRWYPAGPTRSSS
ncbi:MAG: NPCBM/NEW2 domain-containing protein, partial [Planctomycetes bacterium]|nr:NPCBM/NEW2 domain-containing protein [Planctomycetota bacterium]